MTVHQSSRLKCFLLGELPPEIDLGLAWSSPRGALLSWHFNNGYYYHLYETATHIPLIKPNQFPHTALLSILLCSKLSLHGRKKKKSALNFQVWSNTGESVICAKRKRKTSQVFLFSFLFFNQCSATFLFLPLSFQNSCVSVPCWRCR